MPSRQTELRRGSCEFGAALKRTTASSVFVSSQRKTTASLSGRTVFNSFRPLASRAFALESVLWEEKLKSLRVNCRSRDQRRLIWTSSSDMLPLKSSGIVRRSRPKNRKPTTPMALMTTALMRSQREDQRKPKRFTVRLTASAYAAKTMNPSEGSGLGTAAMRLGRIPRLQHA
jgi:hypothetical protein